MTTVSVCMAAYNGSDFIMAQISSILEQLGPHDELIVIDDKSSDNTAEIVAGIDDPRIRLIRHRENRGYVQTFGEAMKLARGDYIFIADQDDIWVPGRVTRMSDALAANQVVATNVAVLGRDGGVPSPYGSADWRLRASDSRRNLRNILGIYAGNRPYFGSAMGLRRVARDGILPFPSYLTDQYDLWIALYGNLVHSIAHLEFRSVEHRFHDNNDTPPRPRYHILAWTRLRLLLATAVLSVRIRRKELRNRL